MIEEEKMSLKKIILLMIIASCLVVPQANADNGDDIIKININGGS